MKIYCIGNDMVPSDAVPIQLKLLLEPMFPDIIFRCVDPTENFIPEKQSIIIDSVEGITQIIVYSDIDVFISSNSVSVHDYDLGLHLQLLKKIHALPPIRIIGVPQYDAAETLLDQVILAIHQSISELRIEG